MNYSVLMAVYYKEEPANLLLSMNSIYCQTVKTDDLYLFVMVLLLQNWMM